MSSSDLPENILPQITSTQPLCFITYTGGLSFRALKNIYIN
jgi:hypothetical protein